MVKFWAENIAEVLLRSMKQSVMKYALTDGALVYEIPLLFSLFC